MNQLKRLNIFIKVIEEMSFAGAARKLGITNAAVSKQVIALEDDLKVQLLRRTTRKLEITEFGKIYYEHAKRIANELQEIENLFFDIRSEPSGNLKIASSWHFAECYLIPNLEEFLNLYPKLKVEMIIMERVPDLAKEGIDLNMGHTFVGGPDDIHKKIAETKYAYCAAPIYLKNYGTPQVPEDLLKHRYITHRNRVPDNTLKFRDGKEIRLEPFLRIDDSRIMIACAKQGLGIIKLHKYAVQEAIRKKELVEVLKGWDTSVQPIYICYQPHRYVQPKIRRFIDFFSSKVSDNKFDY